MIISQSVATFQPYWGLVKSCEQKIPCILLITHCKSPLSSLLHFRFMWKSTLFWIPVFLEETFDEIPRFSLKFLKKELNLQRVWQCMLLWNFYCIGSGEGNIEPKSSVKEASNIIVQEQVISCPCEVNAPTARTVNLSASKLMLFNCRSVTDNTSSV